MTVPFASHDRSAPAWGAGRILRWACIGLAGLAVAGAIAIVVLPLPNPVAGGTCGPGRGAEPAIAAFFDPVSIGAGAQPPSGTLQNYQWQAFVGECQSATNARMVDALALLVLAAFFGLVVPPLVRRAWWHEMAQATHGAPAGWYPDPADHSGWRWWDGRVWSHQTSSASGTSPPDSPQAPASWPPTGAPPPPAAQPGPAAPVQRMPPEAPSPGPSSQAPSPPPSPWSAGPSADTPPDPG